MLVSPEIQISLHLSENVWLLGDTVKFMEEFVYGANGQAGLGQMIIGGVEKGLNIQFLDAIYNPVAAFIGKPDMATNRVLEGLYAQRNLAAFQGEQEKAAQIELVIKSIESGTTKLATPASEAAQVKIKDGHIPVNGQAYKIKGVTLSTASVGQSRRNIVLNLDSVGGEKVVQMMEDTGINTVRTYVALKLICLMHLLAIISRSLSACRTAMTDGLAQKSTCRAVRTNPISRHIKIIRRSSCGSSATNMTCCSQTIRNG